MLRTARKQGRAWCRLAEQQLQAVATTSSPRVQVCSTDKQVESAVAQANSEALCDRFPVQHVRSLRCSSFWLHAEDKRLAVTYFTAAWCGPCRMFSPHYDTMSTLHTEVLLVRMVYF